jgi:hypothetical protein
MSLKQQKGNKLPPECYGPSNVLKRIVNMAYRLELSFSSCAHLVFHVSYLKKLVSDKIPIQTIFPALDEEGKIILEPEIIVEM